MRHVKTVDNGNLISYIARIVTRNIALKVACIESGKEQREIAALAKIHPTRLSQIISNRVTATQGERLRLAGVLQRTVSDLFPEVAA